MTVQPSVAVVGATGRDGKHVFQGALNLRPSEIWKTYLAKIKRIR